MFYKGERTNDTNHSVGWSITMSKYDINNELTILVYIHVNCNAPLNGFIAGDMA